MPSHYAQGQKAFRTIPLDVLVIAGMINDTRNFVSITDEAQVDLPPPRFDEDTSANAQPVQPLPIRGAARWMQRARDAHRKLGARWKSVALVALAGLIIGAASGAMLSNRHPSSLLPTAVGEEAIVETATTEDSIKEVPSTPEAIGIQGDAMAMHRETQPPRLRRHRPALQARRQPRAYRVAVLK
ncbi:MAG TPA: hypothetical protein VMZ30_01445 [Pyrinomonadaceae bacterium]|nr:hypothetical protein [Pyrinomonadaceae bacterium]